MCMKLLRFLYSLEFWQTTQENCFMSTKILSGVSCPEAVSEGSVCYKISIRMIKGIENALNDCH